MKTNLGFHSFSIHIRYYLIIQIFQQRKVFQKNRPLDQRSEGKNKRSMEICTLVPSRGRYHKHGNSTATKRRQTSDAVMNISEH